MSTETVPELAQVRIKKEDIPRLRRLATVAIRQEKRRCSDADTMTFLLDVFYGTERGKALSTLLEAV